MMNTVLVSTWTGGGHMLVISYFILNSLRASSSSFVLVACLLLYFAGVRGIPFEQAPRSSKSMSSYRIVANQKEKKKWTIHGWPFAFLPRVLWKEKGKNKNEKAEKRRSMWLIRVVAGKAIHDRCTLQTQANPAMSEQNRGTVRLVLLCQRQQSCCNNEREGHPVLDGSTDVCRSTRPCLANERARPGNYAQRERREHAVSTYVA
jgi:hypothetical protein